MLRDSGDLSVSRVVAPTPDQTGRGRSGCMKRAGPCRRELGDDAPSAGPGEAAQPALAEQAHAAEVEVAPVRAQVVADGPPQIPSLDSGSLTRALWRVGSCVISGRSAAGLVAPHRAPARPSPARRRQGPSAERLTGRGRLRCLPATAPIDQRNLNRVLSGIELYPSRTPIGLEARPSIRSSLISRVQCLL
jgi:hypothetical protein